MANTRDKVYDAAGNVKPYVERAMSDDKLRHDVMSAVVSAEELYTVVLGGRGAVSLATRVATDDDVREKLRAAIDDLRSASDRLQGRSERSGRNAILLITGIVLGLLFNPVTGPDTRRWLKQTVSGSDDDFGGDYPPAAANGGA